MIVTIIFNDTFCTFQVSFTNTELKINKETQLYMKTKQAEAGEKVLNVGTVETDSTTVIKLNGIRRFKMLPRLILKTTQYQCCQCEMSTVEQIIYKSILRNYIFQCS